MDASLVAGGLGEEFPGEKVGVFDLTVWTVLGEGSFDCDSCNKNHVEGFEMEFRVGDCEKELARKEGTG